MKSKREYIYVVFGDTGEYSDRDEWPVEAHRTEAEAIEHIRKLDEWIRANGVNGRSRSLSYSDRAKLVNPYDPDMRVDYTGVSYRYERVPLSSALAEQLTIIEPQVRKVVLK